MELKESIRLFEQAEVLISKEELFEEPEITFVIIKKTKRKNKFIIGVRDQGSELIYHAYGKKNIYNDEQIRYKEEYELLGIKKCIEGYILTCLHDGCEIVYMDLSWHGYMWDFIADYIDDVMNFMKKGVYSYLFFCNITGISCDLLEYQCHREMTDIAFMLVENCFDDYDLLLSEFIGDKRVMLGFQERIVHVQAQAKTEFIYRVMVVDVDTLEIEYSDYHSMIENAFADYNNHFFALSFSCYKSKELENNQLIKDFKQIAGEPLY
ncbi:MAG: hypothetical protein ACI4SR_01405 [Faecalibacillus sp.]